MSQLPETIAEIMVEDSSASLYGAITWQHDAEDLALNQYMRVAKEAVTLPGDPTGVNLSCILEDSESTRQTEGFKNVWNGFLRAYNFYQFLPNAFFLTREGINQHLYDGIKLHAEQMTEELPTAPAHPDQETWQEVMDLTNATLHGLLNTLKNAGWPAPEAGYELESGGKGVVATAELAWTAPGLAFLREEESIYAKEFTSLDWTVHLLSEVMNDPENYLALNPVQMEQ